MLFSVNKIVRNNDIIAACNFRRDDLVGNRP